MRNNESLRGKGIRDDVTVKGIYRLMNAVGLIYIIVEVGSK